MLDETAHDMRTVTFSAIVGVVGLLGQGCVIATTTTQLEVREPSEVTLAVPTTAPLTSGRDPADVVLGKGEFATEVGASARYALHAVREEGGPIVLEWDTRAPILNGERQVLVGRSGVVDIADSAVFRDDLALGKSLQLASCATLRARHARNVFVGWRAAEWEGCGGAVSVPFVIETPWSNVVRLRQRVEPMRGVAAVGMVLATLVFGGVGALLLGIPCKSGQPSGCETTKNVLAYSMLSIGGAIDLALLPTLVAPASETQVLPPR